ncbi:MAG: class I SAM-dependent methyltransferase [Terracidiphilus sp.]|jgi:SAM-dependent methyltransferase
MTTAIASPRHLQLDESEQAIRLCCPCCAAASGLIGDRDDASLEDMLRCQNCGLKIRKTAGVWRMLTTDQQTRLASFVKDYEFIRRKEGRWSNDPAFYLALPFADLTGNFSDQWRIRARSFRYIERKLLPQMTNLLGPSLRILDIGAGNGWLSYRLALAGHRPAAVDLCANAFDGLEAAAPFATVLEDFFPRFQAEMDRLPFADAQFDVAIFNASLHYSTGYMRTIREAVRCLRPGGYILIVDSPSYRRAEAGEAMRAERARRFQSEFDARGRALPSREYLTPEDIEELSTLGVRWTKHLPWFGLRWWMRPWIARLKRRREPSQFYLYEGRLETL